jgi:hypothetical protein
MMKVKRNKNKNNKNRNNNQTNPNYQNNAQQGVLIYKIPLLYPSDELAWAYTRWFNVENPVYTNATSNNYTLVSGSDVRFASFNSLLGGVSQAFASLGAAFRFFTVLCVELRYDPQLTNENQVSTNPLPVFYANVDDDTTSGGNPTNSQVYTSFNSLRHPITKVTSTNKRYIHKANPYSTFASSMNVKYSTTTSIPTGQFVIGSSPTGTMPTVIQQIGVISFNFCVVFEGSKL